MRNLMICRSLQRSLVAAVLMIAAIGAPAKAQGASLAGEPTKIGDPAKGLALIQKLGCGACHEIPGVIGAGGMVGPPLGHMARRQYIAGMLRNTPDNMVTWLRFPQRVVPGNAMPNLGISDRDAHQIAAFLATLK